MSVLKRTTEKYIDLTGRLPAVGLVKGLSIDLTYKCFLFLIKHFNLLIFLKYSDSYEQLRNYIRLTTKIQWSRKELINSKLNLGGVQHGKSLQYHTIFQDKS